MNPTITYFGKVSESGKLTIVNRAHFDRDLLLNFPGKEIEISVQKKRRKRSNAQNSYYWAVVVPIVRQGLFDVAGTWYDKEEVHEFLKGKFNKEEIVNSDGVIESMPRSTAKLTPTAFNEYFTEIINWSSEYLNVTIPLPNSQVDIKFT